MGTQGWDAGGKEVGLLEREGDLEWGWRLERGWGGAGAVARLAEEAAVCTRMRAQVWRPGEGWSPG